MDRIKNQRRSLLREHRRKTQAEFRDTKKRRMEAAAVNNEIAERLTRDGNRGLNDILMEEMQVLQTNNNQAQAQMPITQPSPDEYEAILREIGTYIFHELSDDEWLGELVEREEQ